jgi:hypothetical protein
MEDIAANLKDSSNLDIDHSVLCFYELALQKVVPLGGAIKAQAAAQKSSNTTQTGAPGGSNGSTSAVSKPNTPMSLATEYGGITSSTSNQTMTLQTTLDGIPYGLVTHTTPYCWSPVVTIPGCLSASKLQWLNRVGVGVTANTSTPSQNVKGTAAPSQTTAQQASLSTAGSTATSLSSVFAKYTIYRGKVTVDLSKVPDYKLGPEGQAISQLLETLPEPALTNYNNWKKNCLAKFTAANLDTPQKRNDYFARYYAPIVGILFKNPPDQASCGENASVATVPAIQVDKLQPYQKQLLTAYYNYLASLSLFQAGLDKTILAAAKPVIAVEYDFNTPVNQPTTSTAKLVVSKPWLPKKCASSSKKPADKSSASPDSSREAATPAQTTDTDPKDKKNPCVGSAASGCMNQLTATLNAGGNFYNSTPLGVPGASAFRDAQVGTEFDYAICTANPNPILAWLGNATFGLTYYYQDQKSPSILKVTPGMPLPGISITGLASTTSTVFATKGPINFVQLKYGLGTGKNVKFPIAVSWSNRTDLITHSLWSAQFGVSYDFSSLFNSSSSADTSSGK